MTFLFVDSIESWALDNPIEGTYTIPYDSPYLTRDLAGDLVFMPSLIAEAIGQMGAWAVMKERAFTQRPVAGVVSSVKMLTSVKPGDTLQLKATVDSLLPEQVQYHGEASVNGQTAVVIEKALGPFLPMPTFIEDEVVRAQCESIPVIPKPKPVRVSDLQEADKSISGFDKILAFEKDKPVLAEKQLDANAPFLKDHFPLKPVLPLSLFIHMKIGLAVEYIKEFTRFSYRFIETRKIKMSQFVTPGDSVSTTMTLKSANENEMIFVFRSMVEGKRVCVSEARFY